MLTLSPDQIASFRDEGLLVVDKLIDQATVICLRERFDRLFEGEFETGVQPDEVNWQEGSSDPSLTRQICNGWKAARDIARVVLREDLGKAIATLAEWPGTRIVQDNVLFKPPGARSIGYHRDNAYLAWYQPTAMLSCWIALDDTSAAGGTIEFARGSHRWPPTEPKGEFHGPSDYRAALEQHSAEQQQIPDIVHVEVAAGGGSFHHGWLWHGSGENLTNRPRRALVLHAMRSDARYAKEHLGKGNGPIYSRYRKLGSDDMDENYFPVLWRSDGYRTTMIDAYLAD